MNEKRDKIFNFFDRISGSKVWPSSDRSDSPCDTFVCKICKGKIIAQMYGAHPINKPSFEDRACETLLKHIKTHVEGL